MAKLIVDGQVVEPFHDSSLPLNVVAQWVEEMYSPDSTFSIELSPAELLKHNRDTIRNKLNVHVADSASLLGTTSDTAHLVLKELSALVGKLSDATSLAQVREAASPIKQSIGNINSQVENGELNFPYMTKGQTQVMTDIVSRANAVDAVIKSN